jgi:hypothetical protein
LAQLTSETRNFQDFGAFSLNYSYSLSGALSSITSSLGTVGYNYDNVGRLSGVTGGASGYASNMQLMGPTHRTTQEATLSAGARNLTQYCRDIAHTHSNETIFEDL